WNGRAPPDWFRRRVFLVVISEENSPAKKSERNRSRFPLEGVVMTYPIRFAAAIFLFALLPVEFRADDALPAGAVAQLGVARPHWDNQVAVAFRSDGTAVTADDTLNVVQ